LEASAQYEDPEFTTALGLLLLGHDKAGKSGLALPGGPFIKKLIKYFVP